MAADDDLVRLAEVLNRIATLYQFRSPDERLYGSLTVSQSYSLRVLYFRGSRSMTELAAELNVPLSTITGIVDQLESKHLVERADHPEDRRSLRVALTAQGKALYRSAHEAFLSHLEPLLATRPPVQREMLLSFLSEVPDAIAGWRKNPTRKAKKDGN